MKRILIAVGGIMLIAYFLFLAAFYSASRQRPDLVTRINAAGGVDALKEDCLRITASTVHQPLLKSGEYPPTIAKLHPVRVSGNGGYQGNVILAWFELDDCGIEVAPAGCPHDFIPVRPPGHPKAWKVADGVFAFKKPTRARHAWIHLRERWYDLVYAVFPSRP